MVSSKLNLANDPLPGQSVASGTGAPQYGGVRGQRVALGPDEIRFDAPTGTLFGGIYQYVIFRAGATAVPARGLLCFWDTSVAENLYQVTNDENIGSAPLAGVTLNPVTSGNFAWIQVGGKATVKTRTALTLAGAAGQPVYAAYAGAGADVATVDNTAAAAGAATVIMVDKAVRAGMGVFEGTPAGATLQVAQLRPWFLRL
jgi:hypothetical protein